MDFVRWKMKVTFTNLIWLREIAHMSTCETVLSFYGAGVTFVKKVDFLFWFSLDAHRSVSRKVS